MKRKTSRIDLSSQFEAKIGGDVCERLQHSWMQRVFLNLYTVFCRKMDYAIAMLPRAESLTMQEHAGNKRALYIRVIRRNYCAKGQRERARFPPGISSLLR